MTREEALKLKKEVKKDLKSLYDKVIAIESARLNIDDLIENFIELHSDAGAGAFINSHGDIMGMEDAIDFLKYDCDSDERLDAAKELLKDSDYMVVEKIGNIGALASLMSEIVGKINSVDDLQKFEKIVKEF